MTALADTIWRLHEAICKCYQRLLDRRLGPARKSALRASIERLEKELEHHLELLR